MPYKKLSDQIQELGNPQRSDTFVKQFRAAVRDGVFDAAEIPERFELPKSFAKRGSGEKYSKSVKDMVFDSTPEFDAWFANIDAELSSGRGRVAAPKPSLEAIESGALDFKALAVRTRQKMAASFEKGQRLGSTRPGGADAAKKKTPAKANVKIAMRRKKSA